MDPWLKNQFRAVYVTFEVTCDLSAGNCHIQLLPPMETTMKRMIAALGDLVELSLITSFRVEGDSLVFEPDWTLGGAFPTRENTSDGSATADEATASAIAMLFHNLIALSVRNLLMREELQRVVPQTAA